jgi:hypothetical protein
MDADIRRKTQGAKEVKRLKRYIIAAVIVVVALIVVPAAFAGYRPLAMDGYTPVATCTGCHGSTVPPASDWAETAHASVANNTEQSNRSGCAGCHSGNFDPAQPIAWDEDPASPDYGTGLNPSEARVACSSCHYNGITTHAGSAIWNPGNPDFSPLAYGQFANPEVCGQCHDQRSRAIDTYPVYDPANPDTPIDTLLRFWPGYDPYTTPLADVINVGSELLMWPDSPYTRNVHDTGAVQYDEMVANYGHFNSLDGLKAIAGFLPENEPVNLCSHCMSADQRILVEAGKLNVDPENPTSTPTDSQGNPVTLDDLKYGVTCVACHDPHKRGVSNSVWGGEHEGDMTERNAQLIMPRKDLCASCHNGELRMFDPTATSFAPGAELNHPTAEFMDGIGAIDVPKTPALHKGLCVQCHMVPTAVGSDGSPSVAANHIFTPIMPEEAMNTTVVLSIGGVDTTVHMPYSACSTCHEGTNGDNVAKTEAMQEIIDQRQEWTHGMVDEVMATLDAKAVQMGFANAEEAIGDADVADSDFGKAWTNMELVAQEGSWGVHNWQYGVAVINKAMEQADAYRVPVAGVTIASSAAKITYGQTLTLSGKVSVPAGGPALMDGDMVRLWVNGAAANFATLSGGSYSFTGVKPNKTSTFQVQFVGDTNYAPTIGDSVKVNVRYAVTLTTAHSTYKAGTKVLIQGTVRPTAGPVTVQRYVSGKWKTFKSGLSVNSKGRWSYSFTIKKATYKLRVYKPASATLVAGYSNNRVIAGK